MKNKKQYMTALAVLIMTLMIAGSISSAVKVDEDVDNSGNNEILTTLNTPVEETFNADTYSSRDHGTDWGWLDWSSHGQDCDNYYKLDNHYISYTIQLTDFNVKYDDITGVQFGAYFKSDCFPGTGGPDLEAKKGTSWIQVKRSMGCYGSLTWKWYSVTNDYVSSSGVVHIRMLCAGGTHAYLSKVGIRYEITNFWPTAHIESVNPSSPTRNEDVTLSGHGEDPDEDSIDSYKWKDGSTEIGSKKTITVSLSKGTHNIEFLVKDSRGQWSAPATKSVTVSENEAPVMNNIGGPSSGKPRQMCSFTFTATDKNKDKVKFEIDWDDGSSTQTTSYCCQGESLTVSHEFTLSDSYKIKARALDKDYNSASEWMTKSFSTPKAKPTGMPALHRMLEEHFPALFWLLEMLDL